MVYIYCIKKYALCQYMGMRNLSAVFLQYFIFIEII